MTNANNNKPATAQRTRWDKISALVKEAFGPNAAWYSTNYYNPGRRYTLDYTNNGNMAGANMRYKEAEQCAAWVLDVYGPWTDGADLEKRLETYKKLSSRIAK